jgi:hypothetical protein
MKQPWALVGVAVRRFAVGAVLAPICVLSGCNDYGNTFQNPTGAAITGLSPSNVSAGGPDFTITVIGSGFVAKTVVQWNQKTIPTQVQTDSSGAVTGITGTVSAALIAKAGTAFVNTLSPASGAGNNGLSNSIAFIINNPSNPVPSITSMSPASAAAGSASFTLTVNGSNFLPTSDPSGGSQVHWNLGGTQSTLPIVSISSTQMQATVGTTLLVNSTNQAVTAIVTVFNPPSPQSSSGGVPNPTGGGGGTSPNGLSFTITPAGTNPSSSSVSQAVAEDTPAISMDARYVAYSATQSDHTQVFVRDTCQGAAAGCQANTTLVSAAPDGTPGGDDSRSPSMSSDGRYVAFSSAATNLVAGAPAGRQVYLRDTCFGTASGSCTPSTHLISTDENGALTGTESISPSVSASGRFVAFLAVTPSHTSQLSSQAKTASTGTDSSYRQVFVRDTCLGATGCQPSTTRVSMQSGGGSSTDSKPAGPALTGGADHVAIGGMNPPTLFTQSVAVDDHVFVALIGQKN